MCGSEVVRAEGEADYRCVNVDCPARLKESVLHFASRKVMNIDGLGEALVVQLLERQMLTQRRRALFAERSSSCLELERIGQKTAQSLLAEIENSKKAPLNRVLFGLGIRFVGERTAQLLAEAFGSMDALMAASVEELEAVDEVGPRVAQAIQEFFAEAEESRTGGEAAPGGSDLHRREEAKVVTAGGSDVCADRHHGRPDARRGKAQDRSSRGARFRLGQQEDELCGRGRRRRIEARQSPGPEGSGDRPSQAAGDAGLVGNSLVIRGAQEPPTPMRAE